jgi:hypothetical protein
VNAALIAVALSDTIQKLGSYAGLASVVGLGVLSLLYFSQAREVKRLREWAGRAPERAVELEQRVQADAQRRVVAQPLAPATTAAQKAEAARTAAAAALYAKVPPPPPPPAPLVNPPGQLARPVLPGTVPAAGSAATASGEVAATTPAPVPGSAPDAMTPGTAEPAVPPATTAAAAARQAAASSHATSAHENGNGGQETRESAAARPDPPDLPAPPSTVAGLAGLPGPDHDDDGGMSTGRIAAIVGAAVVTVLAVVVVMLLSSGNDTTTKPNDFGSVTQPSAAGAQSGSPANAGAATPGLDRRATRVAVLNGTTQTGLARAVADKIEQAKFTIAGTQNNADQSVPTTTVSYRAGNQRAAQVVAQVIGIDSSSVQAVDANTSAAADADVVVIVGADKIG